MIDFKVYLYKDIFDKTFYRIRVEIYEDKNKISTIIESLKPHEIEIENPSDLTLLFRLVLTLWRRRLEILIKLEKSTIHLFKKHKAKKIICHYERLLEETDRWELIMPDFIQVIEGYHPT